MPDPPRELTEQELRYCVTALEVLGLTPSSDNPQDHIGLLAAMLATIEKKADLRKIAWDVIRKSGREGSKSNIDDHEWEIFVLLKELQKRGRNSL